MSRPPLAALRPFGVTASILLLAGCAASRQSFFGDGFFAKITPYRIEIVQGNVITSEQAARIKPGLSRLQVRDILGTPLLADPFHGDRWDYIFTIRRDGLPNQRRSVVVWFEGDTLKTIEAPDLPSEREFVARHQPRARSPKVPVLELTEAQRKPPAAAAAARRGRHHARRTGRPCPQLPAAGGLNAMATVNIAVAGAGGRMGHMLIEAVLASGDCRLSGALDVAGSPALGADAGAFLGRSTGVAVTADLRRGLEGADVLIDFTRPEGTLAHLAVCRELGVRMVIGTTGFDAAAEGRHRRGGHGAADRAGAEHERGRERDAAPAGPGRAFAGDRATTSRSSRPTTATRSTRPAAPRWPWARPWRARWAAT